MTEKEDVTVVVTLKGETRKAYKVELENPESKTETHWFPKSQVRAIDCFAEGDEGEMTVSRWIASQKGLVEDDVD